MKFSSIGWLICCVSLGMAQDSGSDTTLTTLPEVKATPDTVKVDSVANAVAIDSSVKAAPIVPVRPKAPQVKIPPEQMGLDYGYKGYPWGSSIGNLPPNMPDTSYAVRDSTLLIMKGKLGSDNVVMYYSYSDSGFWKVEIDYQLDVANFDFQIKKFYEIEKSLFAVYRSPKGINQVIAGPKSGIKGISSLAYERAYLHTSWKDSQCQIELILLAAVQSPATDLPVLTGPTSILRLVYFNPDFMVKTIPTATPEKLPSIFDLY